MDNYYLYLIGTLTFAFVINIPFGYKRATTKKFSIPWFLYIHLPIPFVVALRFALELNWKIIPLVLILAVAGQVVGSRLNPERIC